MRVKQAKRRMGLNTRKNLVGYWYVMPFLVGAVLIFLPCLITSLLYSFQKIDFFESTYDFVGWANYSKAFTQDTQFRQILLNSIGSMVLDTLIIIIFSFFIANLLNTRFIGRGLARTVFFLPVILATGIVAAAEAGGDAFNGMSAVTSSAGDQFSQLGLSNFFDLEEMLLQSGLNSTLVNGIVYAIDNTYHIINASGVQILIFLSALQSISPSVFEASMVEGATKWEEFWKITFPLLTPMIFVNIVYTVVDTFTNPSYGVMAYVQQQGIQKNDMGFASAMSWVYFAVVLVFLGLITVVISKRIVYIEE